MLLISIFFGLAISVFRMISLVESILIFGWLLWSWLDRHEFTFNLIRIFQVGLNSIILVQGRIILILIRFTWCRWLSSTSVSLVLLTNCHCVFNWLPTNFWSFVRCERSHVLLLGCLTATYCFCIFRSRLIRLDRILHVLNLMRSTSCLWTSTIW